MLNIYSGFIGKVILNIWEYFFCDANIFTFKVLSCHLILICSLIWYELYHEIINCGFILALPWSKILIFRLYYLSFILSLAFLLHPSLPFPELDGLVFYKLLYLKLSQKMWNNFSVWIKAKQNRFWFLLK